MYGLRQAPKRWPDHLASTTKLLKFERESPMATCNVMKVAHCLCLAYVDLLIEGDKARTKQFPEDLLK